MHELGLSYRTKPIGPRTGETKTTEYTRLNPRQKVPLLQDGDFCIGESAAIVAYLSRAYSTAERSLIPETPREYATWLEWCFFVVAELDSTSLYVMRRHRADALGPIYGVAPEVVAKAGEYFREHFYLTTSGYFSTPPFQCMQQVVGIDRIMFSVDYPFSSNIVGRTFLDHLPISAEEKEKVAHGNAEKLLRI